MSVTLLTTSISGWLNYNTSKNIIVESLKDNATSELTIHASQLGTWLQTRQLEVEVMANTDLVRFGKQQDILQYFVSERKRTNDLYSSIGIGDTKGNLTLDEGITIQIGSEATFPDVMAGKNVISNPFPDKADPNNLIVAFEVPVFDRNNKVNGVVSGATPINQVFKETTDFKIGKTDTIYVIQQDGLIIHHPDQKKVLSENLLQSSNAQTKQITQKIIDNKQGIETVDVGGEQRIYVYSKVPHTTWTLVLEVPLTEFTAKLTPLLTIAIVSGIATLLLNGLIMFFLLRNTMRRINRVVVVADEISNGNLAVTLLEDNGHDEVGNLATSVNKMANHLHDVLKQVNVAVTHVTDASNQLASGVHHASDATQSITKAAEEVSSVTKFQLESIQQNTEALDQMSVGIQRVATSTSDIFELVSDTEQQATEGNQNITQAIKQMDSIHQSVNKSSQVVQLLANRSKEISEISNIITGISDQTNLLALNAAIEAARAGEHGKGFAVVADEVRTLAEQSKESASKISALISEIQVDTSEAVQAMAIGSRDVQSGTEIVNHAGEIFNHILQAIQEITRQIQEVSASSEQMSASTQEMNASSSEMLSISQKTAENAQAVTHESNSQLATIQTMKESTETLEKMIVELQQTMNQFKL